MLRHFNMMKPRTIHVDISDKGLATTLIQDDGAVAFTSKALIPKEQRHANNERELLICVFSTKCFWTYVFESDCKPLEQISMKNLADTPGYL